MLATAVRTLALTSQPLSCFKNVLFGATGTAALLNSVAWVESEAWDGRWAIAVCGDIAVYEPGPARPTGGCAAVAMLIGPQAPIRVEAKRSSHFENAYDFYKPNLSSEYPVVFGQESNTCYTRALDVCWQGLKLKHANALQLGAFDYAIFHSPYNKLVRKSFARLAYLDTRANPSLPHAQAAAEAAAKLKLDLPALLSIDPRETYDNKDIASVFNESSKRL
jgi:hydroxymethylglutaryl-CoA synthase